MDDIFEMTKRAEERVKRFQERAKIFAEKLNEEFYEEEEQRPSKSELLPLPVNRSKSYNATEDIFQYLASRSRADFEETEREEESEETSKAVSGSPERRDEREMNNSGYDTSTVHVSVPSRSSAWRASDYIDKSKKHHISMPVEIPERYRYVIPSKKKEEIDYKELVRKQRDEPRLKLSLDSPPKKREPEERHEHHHHEHAEKSAGISKLAKALNLDESALDTDELLLLTLILLLAEDGGDMPLLIALMYILI